MKAVGCRKQMILHISCFRAQLFLIWVNLDPKVLQSLTFPPEGSQAQMV